VSSLKNTLTEAMKDAMRAKAKFRLGVIRMVLADIKRVEVDERIEVDDARCLSIIDKMTKQRRDAANQFVDGGRQDLADTELAEVEILKEFLPTPLTDDEIIAFIDQVDQRHQCIRPSRHGASDGSVETESPRAS
jgi:uncharacterized protein YqeY